MLSVKSLSVVAIVALANLVSATPPGCLLLAVNTQPNPGDLKSICGAKKDEVLGDIGKMCPAGAVKDATEAFGKVCNEAGIKVDNLSVPSTLMTATATTGSVKPSGSGTSKPTGTGQGSEPSKPTGTGQPAGPGSGTESGAPKPTGTNGTAPHSPSGPKPTQFTGAGSPANTFQSMSLAVAAVFAILGAAAL